MAEQSYSNHARHHAPYHYVLVPLLTLNLVWTTYRVYQRVDTDRLHAFSLAIVLFLMAYLLRISALKAQDRLIRLEERLRYERVLPPELAARAAQLEPRQIIALRFASDGELAERVTDLLEGRVSRPADIKKAIRVWRPDTFRV